MAFIMLNSVAPPDQRPPLRQALAKGLDQATIQKIFGGGFAKPVNGLFLPGSPYYSRPPATRPTTRPAAKQLVAPYKAQHGTPSLELLTITDPRLAQVVQIIQQMWQQVGVNVTVGQVEQADLINDFIAGKFQAATSYQFGAVDPDLNYVWWSTTTVGPIGSIALNFPRNCDPVIEQAMLTGRHTTDQATRVQAYQTVNEQLAKDLPYLWLEQYIFSEVATDQVQNFANPTLPNGMARLRLRRGHLRPHPDLAVRVAAGRRRHDAPMGKYLLRRFLQLVVVSFVISVLVFLLVHLLPGDPTDAASSAPTTPPPTGPSC